MAWVAKHINEQVLFHPRDVVTATEFNSLFNLLIAQGNNNAQGVESLIGIFGSVTDGESGADYVKVTPVSGVTGTNVQEILEGLKGLVDQRYTKSETDALLDSKASNEVVAKLVKNVQFEEGTGKFTFVFQDSTTKVIDTALEKITVNFSYDSDTQSLVLIHIDGTTESISLAEFITNNEFLDSDTINISVTDGVVKAEIGVGVITDEMLSSTLLATLVGYVSSASGSAQAAASSESNASAYAQTASAAADTATQKAADASNSAYNAENANKSAQSFAKGNTGTREGEDTDNAKYYAEQASASAASAGNSAQTAAASENNAADAANTATNAASSANASAISAEESAQTASEAEQTAIQKAQNAYDNATQAQEYMKSAKSFAKGGTGTRNGEDADNAQYYFEQAKLKAIASGDSAIDAAASATIASNAASSAELSAQAAEQAKNQAQEIVGGDFLNKSGDGSDLTAAFTEATERNNISTGEKMSILFGKIKKCFSDLKGVAFSGDYTDLINTPAPEIFIATYGTTTNAEIEAAYQAGKVVYCKVNGTSQYFIPFIGRGNENYHIFTWADPNTFTRQNGIIACINNKWSISYITIPAIKVITATLTIDGWEADGDGFKQIVTVSNIPTSGYIYTVYPNSSQYKAWTEAGIYADDVTTANSLTFHCVTKPTVAVTVNIKKDQVT